MSHALLIAAAAGALLGACVSGVIVSGHWESKLAQLQQQNAEHDAQQVALIAEAQTSRDQLQAAQAAANTAHAAELAAARANTRTVVRKVTEYVDANPSDPVCRLSPELVGMLNRARSGAVPATADPD